MYSTKIENCYSYGTFILPSNDILYGSLIGFASYSRSLDYGKTMARIINSEGNILIVEPLRTFNTSSIFGGYDFAYIHQDLLRSEFENNYYYTMLNTNEQLFYENIYNWAFEMEKFDTVKGNIKYFGPIDYVKYNITYEEALNIVVMFEFDNPRFSFINLSAGVYTFSSLNHFIGLQINDRYNDTLISYDNSSIDTVIDEIQAAVVGLSDYEKVLYIYNYLKDNVDYTSYSASTSSIVGPILNREGICEGYALTFKFISDQIGIESIVISSDEMDHAWNMVLIEGNWYFVDVTWADTGDTEYFLMGSNEFYITHFGINSYLYYPQPSENNYLAPME